MSIQITWHTQHKFIPSQYLQLEMYIHKRLWYFLIYVNRYQSALQTLSDLSCLNCHKQLTQRPLSYSFRSGKLKNKSPNSIAKYIHAVLRCNTSLGREKKNTDTHLKCSFQKFNVSDNTLNYKGSQCIKIQRFVLILQSQPTVNKTNIQLS